MASFSQSPNSLPVSDSALPLRLLLFPSPSPSPSHLPASTTASLPSSPPSTDPPPATVPSPSRLPISAPPPTASPPTLSSTPPSSPLPPPTNTPLPPSSPSSPSPPTSSPPPPSLIPPADPPPPPSSPSPPASSPPPPSLIPPTVSPPPPSSPSPPATSPPPPLSPHVFPPKPPSNPSRGSPPLPSFSPPPFPPPPLSPHVFPPKPPSSPSRGSPPLPSFSPPPPRNTSVTPKKSPSIPPGPILSPPPHTPLSLRPSRNSSSPLVIVASPPPFKQPAPSPSEVVILHPGSPSNTNRPSSNGGIATGGIVGITAVLGILLLTTIITVSWCLYKRNKKIAGHNEQLHGLSTSMDSLPQSSLLKIQASAAEIGIISGNDLGYSHSRSKFTYEDLYEATNGFSPQNLLGSGGFGYVYKGFLVDGTEVAVKELKIGGGQGEREFSAEVEIISRIHHRYLVSLVGYCVSENKRLLVYEYVPNNTLYYHLHVSELVLDWPTRVRVASGAARGIAYLHEDCHPRVIHRDIKSSNILLDKNFEARVSDFGLAKLAADVHTHVTTRVMGTFGYMAPEYARSGNLSEKSDVFSFGVVLLELITGRKPVDASQPWGDEGLVEWSRPLLSHALETEDFKLLVDPRLGINFVPNEMFRMIEAAAACIRHSAIKRPRMGQIVRAFENLETEDLNNGMRVGESEIYNSAQQSAEIKLFQRMAFGSRNYSTDYFTQSSWATNSTDW